MLVKIESSWKVLLAEEFKKEYFVKLTKFVKTEYLTKQVFPEPKYLFRAFDLCPVDRVKVVILGQDPYHRVNDYNANGLAFSVNKSDKIPPSLANIYKELKSDLQKDPPINGDLSSWASQGVLLLNATLTVLANQAGSHQKKGWEKFTDAVIKKLDETKINLVFILWGNYAKKKSVLIDKNKHLILESAHPSPFSANNGFFGSKPFSKCNNYLKKHNLKIINW